MDLNNIIKYAHISEIVDRISIEKLKVAEFKRQLASTEDNTAASDLNCMIQDSNDTAKFQEEVLRERISLLNIGSDEEEALADMIINIINISIGAAIVSIFENMKRVAHDNAESAKKITFLDLCSRDACEMRAQGKGRCNQAIKYIYKDYEFPTESRTFKEEL